ncbi:MAG: cell division protein FtsZ [Pseudomonadota bacterium]
MFELDDQVVMGARIKIIGVGGGGGNAINTMIASGFGGVDFIAANTDKQCLERNKAPIKVQLGKQLTKGLGAGGNPDTGRKAACEDEEHIKQLLTDSDMVFITAGMGGGTGTGAAPVIARISREVGALTIGVVTRPFIVEGVKRQKQAELGLDELKKYVDTLIIIPNERLLGIIDHNTSQESGFKKVDEVLLHAVRGISDLINKPGHINLDFADIKSIMKNSNGVALVGIGSGTGEDRAKKAARNAITSPLLGNLKISGASGLIVNITAGPNLPLKEIIEAAGYIKDAAGSTAEVKLGVVSDESLANEIRMTVVATGISELNSEEKTGEAEEQKEEDEFARTQCTGIRKKPEKNEYLYGDLFNSAAIRKHQPRPTNGTDDDLDTPPFIRKGKKISTELD